MKQKNSNNPWHILGIEPDSTLDEVKLAYRRMTKKHHPDAGGKVANWLRIQSAYEEIKEKNFIPILQGPSTKMLDILLTLKQQIQGVDDLIKVEDENDLFIKVKIPPGAKSGDKFRVSGNDTNYIINIKEKPHSDFTRQGNHLILYKTLPIVDVLKRSTFLIKTATDEYMEVQIPEEIQTGSIIVVPGHGMFDRKTKKRGNIRIQIKIDIPIVTDENIQEFITRLRND